MCPSDIAGGCPHSPGCSAPPDANGLSATALAERIGHLYLCEELSTYRIAAILGISRQRIGRMLHRMGAPVKARGLGRRRQPDAQSGVTAEILKILYLQQRLTSGQVSALTGIPERTVRDRLRAAGVDMRSRGGQNRQARRTVPAEAVAELYLHAGLSAAEAGSLLHVPGRVILRTAHDLGLPVRVGGPPPRTRTHRDRAGGCAVRRSARPPHPGAIWRPQDPGRRPNLAALPGRLSRRP